MSVPSSFDIARAHTHTFPLFDLTFLSTDLLAHVLQCVSPVRERWLTFVTMMCTCKHTHDAALVWLRSVQECDSHTMPFPLWKLASIVQTGSLRRMTFDDECDNAILTLASHCPALERIDLDVDFSITNRALEALVRQKDEGILTHLAFSGTACSVSDRGVVALAHGCPKLTHLHLELSWTSDVTDASVTSLASNCVHLSHLTLKCSGVTDDGIKALAHLPQLVYLDLESSSLVTASSVHMCSCLSTLVLRSCHNVSDAALSAVATHCRSLSHIDVSRCRNVCDDNVVDMSMYCPHLTHVNLAHCVKISDDGICSLTAHCPHLEYVNVTGCYGVSTMGRVLIQSRGVQCVYCTNSNEELTTAMTSVLSSVLF